MDLNACYRLAPQAAIRPERFGGLVYRHDNRRLYFLYSAELVAFVSSLDGSCRLGAALDSFLAERALPEVARVRFIQALARLEQLQIVDVG